MFERWAGSPRSWLPVVLAVLVLGSAPTFLRAFINDDATYVLVAQRLNEGGRLYRDAVDNKPPLIYLTCAALFRLWGGTSVALVKVAAWSVQLGCAALVFVTGRRLFDERVARVAALLFAVSAMSGLVEDFAAPNTELFANLCLLGAVAVIARPVPRLHARALLGAGLLLGAGVLYRLPAAVAFVAVLAELALRPGPRGERTRDAALVTLGFLLPVGLALIVFGVMGTLPDFWQWAVRNNLVYVHTGESRIGWRALGRLALVLVTHAPCLLLAARAGGAWRGLPDRQRASLRLVSLQLVAALFSYRLGSRFYGHYFVPVLPFLALAAAFTLVHLRPSRVVTSSRVFTVMLLVLAGFVATNTSRLSHLRDRDRDLARVAEKLATSSPPTAHVLLWSAPAELLLASDRGFATRFPFNNWLTGRLFGTDLVRSTATREETRPHESAEGWRLFLRDLEEAPPDLIVDGSAADFRLATYAGLGSFLRDHYPPPAREGEFLVYRRAL